MHIHPNSSLLLATLGAGREEVRELAAKRAAEVRRKLSAASRVLGDTEDFSLATRIERRSHESQQRHGDEDSFGRLFSAEA